MSEEQVVTAAADTEAATYDADAVQEKWQPVWEELQPFRADDDVVRSGTREKRYALTMFPYPSGDLHMGHAEVFALHDVIARYWWQRGYEVLNPMGFDSFGLNAENAAIRDNEHPATFTYANIAVSTESCKRFGVSFDWTRTFNTSDPEYYRWTQWLFLKFRERGLAYRKNSPVNWCPNDQTVLANEQVIDGRCERCGAEVTKRELTQWYFKITDYAQELLDDLDDLAPTWPERVITAQRNWIGRSEGAHVTFAVEGHEPITVYTTRPDTLFGATFMVVAADAALAADAGHRRAATGVRRVPGGGPQGQRHRAAVHRPTQDRRVPGRARDQPGHRRPDPGLRRRLRAGRLRHRRDHGGAGPGPARLGLRAGLRPADRPDRAAARGLGGRGVHRRRTRDQLRQRLGVAGRHGRRRGQAHDHRLAGGAGRRQGCGELPAARLAAVAPALLGRADPDHPLPRARRGAGPRGPAAGRAARAARRRPDAEGRLAAGRGEDWVNVECPTCGGPAKRDSDTMDTFVDSSWYFLRYCSPHDDTRAFDPELAALWGPCDIYIGGVEHAVLHLLYARFFTKVLRDMGLLEFGEPFSAQLNQGIVINEGAKMSKSKGNGVRLGDQLAEFGVDAVRLTLVFAGPPEDDIDWADMSPSGSLRFLQRAWRLSGDVTSAPGAPAADGDVALRKVTHRTVHEAEQLVEATAST